MELRAVSRKLSNIYYCSCCGKQISDLVSHDRLTTVVGAIKNINDLICGICAKELDSDGCFPEENNF